MEKITNVINEKKFTNYKINIDGEKGGVISGVDKAVGYSQNSMALVVCGKKCNIKGEDLSVVKVDTESGVVEFEGNILEISFGNTVKKKNFLSRLFS